MATRTLDGKHELLGVQHRRPLVLGLLSRLSVAPPLFALPPEVGAAVHAGNVEDGDALQGDGAEVQGDAVTLIDGWADRRLKDRIRRRVQMEVDRSKKAHNVHKCIHIYDFNYLILCFL